MQKITPHLWFDKEAREAAELYASIFSNSAIHSVKTLRNTPSGSVDLVSLSLAGHEFKFLSAGPFVKFTPAVSFLVACQTKDEVDAIWNPLSKGGEPLMPLASYPFSAHYGWIQDRYRLSWQVMFMGDRPIQQKITPTLMFVGAQCGRAQEAVNLYASIFPNSKIDHLLPYAKNEEPDKEGTIKHAGFTLNGDKFAAMDSAQAHNFTFNEAISFMVNCETQTEIDHYWHKLSADPNAGQCGWLKDQFGLSWQVIPSALGRMLSDPDQAKMARVTAAFLQMKKFDLAKLEEAYRQ
ncbi:MAG: VOC family protein [Terriglobales bacterium]